MSITQTKGDMTELQSIRKFVSMGFEVSIPYGNHARYDFLVDTGEEILRMQAKTSRMVDDGKTISFACRTTTSNTKENNQHYYSGKEIDYFVTCWKNNVYIVPVEECSTQKNLRIIPKEEEKSPPNVNYAEDYLVENFLGHLAKYTKEDFEENILTKEQKLKYICKDCGKPVWNKDSRCLECSHKAQRKVERPSREELKDLIRTESFLAIGRKYSVSDSAIRKWCKAYDLPYRVSEIKKIKKEDWRNI